MSEDRFCVNCKHHFMSTGKRSVHICRSPAMYRTVNPVTGNIVGGLCRDNRLDHPTCCGQEGRHFEAR